MLNKLLVPVLATFLGAVLLFGAGDQAKAGYSDEVLAVQFQLQSKGYDPGPADGFSGARTESAIRAYQRRNGLPVDGKATRRLIDHMLRPDSIHASDGGGEEQKTADSPRDNGTTGSPGEEYTLIIQLLLRHEDLDAGTPDGVMGRKTEAAIRTYQERHGLTVDGRATEALFDDLYARRLEAARRRAGHNMAELQRRGTLTYEGELKAGRFSGHGLLFLEDGGKYEGNFEADQFHGQGTMYYADGGIYIGQWVKGKREGRGNMKGPMVTGELHNNGSSDGEAASDKWQSGGHRNEYSGEFKNDRFHGKGTLKYANGRSYDGEFRNGLFHGQGKIQGYFNSYSGEFREGLFHGHGTFTATAGPDYVGQWERGKRHGPGRQTYAGGRVEEGEFRDDKFVGTTAASVVEPTSDPQRQAAGNAIIVYDDGATYKGDSVNGRPHGRGKLVHPDYTYEGPFVNGKANGSGMIDWTDGSRYVGDFRDNKRTGHGEYFRAKVGRYVGEFRDGTIHGRGEHHRPNGSRYVGNFVDGKYHGRGQIFWQTGGHFAGDFVNGKRTGRGEESWPNGHRYVGDYKDETRTGHGEYFWPNGHRYEGEFLNDLHHGKGELFEADGDRYSGEFRNGKKHGYGTQWFASGRWCAGVHEYGQLVGWGNGIDGGRSVTCSQTGSTYNFH